jgi:type I restriction enzyme, S subunit
MKRAASKWKPRLLDELGFVGRGKSRHRPRGDQRLFGGPYPFIQTADIMAADPYITSHSQTYSDFGLQQSKMWEADTLCITIAGANTAKTAILKFRACFPDSVVGFVSDNSKSDIHFVKYSLDLMRQRFLAVSRGATQDNLSLDKLLSFPIQCPDVEEQRRIGGILSAYDELIENSQRRIRLLEDMARALYREWFVHFRFPGHESVPRLPSALGDIPQGWEVKRLDAVCRSVQDGDWIETKDQGGEDYRLLQISNIGVGEFIETGNFRFITQATFERLRCTEIKPGDILVARMPTPIGRAWMATEMPWRMITAVDVAIIRAQSGVLHPLFLAQSWNEPFNLQRIAAQASGTTRLRITRRELAALEFVVPPIEDQLRFAKFVEPQTDMIQALGQKMQNLRRTRDLLLPRLLSGHFKPRDS